jgi:hypothetical protein
MTISQHLVASMKLINFQCNSKISFNNHIQRPIYKVEVLSLIMRPESFFMDIFWIFFFLYALFITASSAPLRLHCVGGCWYRTQNEKARIKNLVTLSL